MIIPGSTTYAVSVADIYGGDLTIPDGETFVAFRLPEDGERIIPALGWGVSMFVGPQCPRSPRIILEQREGA